MLSPGDRLTPELIEKIKAAKPKLLAELSQQPDATRDAEMATPLSGDECAALDQLASAWRMDAEDRAIMLRQCERGAELADGSWLSPKEARAFWLAEAREIH